MAHENAPPKEHSDTQIFSKGKSNDEVGTRPTPCKVSKVKDCGRPVVFFALEMLCEKDNTLGPAAQGKKHGKGIGAYQVFCQVKQRSLAKGQLIHILKHVTESHQRNQTRVCLCKEA